MKNIINYHPSKGFEDILCILMKFLPHIDFDGKTLSKCEYL